MTSKEIKAFLACYVLFAAITVVLSKPANESDKEEKEILKGGLTCITRHRPSDDNITTKFFYVDEEQWPCFNGDGLNNCIQVSLFPEAKTSCLDCCQRLKGSGGLFGLLTVRLHFMMTLSLRGALSNISGALLQGRSFHLIELFSCLFTASQKITLKGQRLRKLGYLLC